MIINNCSIQGCKQPKYIGFIHFKYHNRYNLCMKHYYEMIKTNMSIDAYIIIRNKHKGVGEYDST